MIHLIIIFEFDCNVLIPHESTITLNLAYEKKLAAIQNKYHFGRRYENKINLYIFLCTVQCQ